MKITWVPPLLALFACTAGEGPRDEMTEAPIAEIQSTGGELRERLSGEAAKAYDILASTQRFTDEAIGYAGVTPCEVLALRVIFSEREASTILRTLYSEGGVGTRLYALCGLYYTDPDFFEAETDRMKGSSASIQFQRGCVVLNGYSVADLLDRGEGNAVRLDSRDQTVREWKSGHEDRFSLGYDIVGGGYPDLFRTGGGYRVHLEQSLEGCSD